MVSQTSGEDKPRDVSIEDNLNNLIVPIAVRRLPYTEVDQLQEWDFRRRNNLKKGIL